MSATNDTRTNQQPTARRDGLFRLAALTPDDIMAIRQLEARCNATEGLTLKLSLGEGRRGAATEDGLAFLYFAQGELVGYCALDYSGGDEAELCGMVHPNRRRQGIGRALLNAARLASADLGVSRLLLICEHASASGQAFVAALNPPATQLTTPEQPTSHARLAFAEHHMERPATLPTDSASDDATTLRVRVAGPADVEALATITAAAFGDPIDELRRGITHDLESGDERWLLGEADSEPVGSLRALPISAAEKTAAPPQVGIYGFGVLPARQGQGWGRRILRRTMALLRAEGWARFSLEVETENRRAFALYRSCGFVTTTTYEYYEVGDAGPDSMDLRKVVEQQE